MDSIAAVDVAQMEQANRLPGHLEHCMNLLVKLYALGMAAFGFLVGSSKDVAQRNQQKPLKRVTASCRMGLDELCLSSWSLMMVDLLVKRNLVDLVGLFLLPLVRVVDHLDWAADIVGVLLVHSEQH